MCSGPALLLTPEWATQSVSLPPPRNVVGFRHVARNARPLRGLGVTVFPHSVLASCRWRARRSRARSSGQQGTTSPSPRSCSRPSGAGRGWCATALRSRPPLAHFGLGVGGGLLHDCLGRFPLELEAVASEEPGGITGILHKLTGSDTLSLGLTDQLEGAINAGFCIALGR